MHELKIIQFLTIFLRKNCVRMFMMIHILFKKHVGTNLTFSVLKRLYAILPILEALVNFKTFSVFSVSPPRDIRIERDKLLPIVIQ